MDAIDAICKYGKAGYSLTGGDRHDLPKLVEALKALFQQRASGLVLQTGGRPMLRSYSSDGTPLTVRERVVATHCAVRVVRVGGRGIEFLLQVAFARFADAEGKRHTRVVLRDPHSVGLREEWVGTRCRRSSFHADIERAGARWNLRGTYGL